MFFSLIVTVALGVYPTIIDSSINFLRSSKNYPPTENIRMDVDKIRIGIGKNQKMGIPTSSIEN